MKVLIAPPFEAKLQQRKEDRTLADHVRSLLATIEYASDRSTLLKDLGATAQPLGDGIYVARAGSDRIFFSFGDANESDKYVVVLDIVQHEPVRATKAAIANSHKLQFTLGAKALCWCLCVVALSALVPVLFPQLSVGLLRNYNIQVAQAALTCFGIIGLVWYTYYQREVLRYQQEHDAASENRRRRALAIAMTAELTTVKRDLQGLATSPEALYDVRHLEYPILDRALDSADLFQLRTVDRLADAIQTLARLRASVPSVFSGDDTAFTMLRKDVIHRSWIALDAVARLDEEFLNEAKETPEPRPDLTSDQSAPRSAVRPSLH